MLEGITDLIDNGTVKLCLFTAHEELHLLVKLLGKISDHTRESVNNTLDRYHPDLHNRLMDVGSDTLKVFNLITEARILLVTNKVCGCPGSVS